MESFYSTSAKAFLRYVDLPGDGPTIVWLHGVVCSSTAELLPVAVQPSLRGRRSLLVDFLGYGYSDRPDSFDYTIESHARTVVDLLEALDVGSCHLVGHSFGGTVAIHVAEAMPGVARSVVAAESNVDPATTAGISAPIAAQTEEQFVTRGYAEMIQEHEQTAEVDPAGISARHLGMFRMMSPSAVHRSASSIVAGADRSTRQIFKQLEIARTFVVGELSEEPPDQDLVEAGVSWATVPGAGHPMGLQNPQGFAAVVASAVS